MMMQVTDTEVKVSRVQVAGLQRTKNDIVVEQVKDVLTAGTLQDVLVKSFESLQKLNELNIFKHVDLRLDTAKDRHGNAKGLAVTFLVTEHGRLKSTIAANAGTQSGDTSLSLTLRNLLGRAEQLSLITATTVPLWGHTVQLQFSKPYYKDIEKKLLVAIGNTNTKHPFSGYQAYTTASNVALHFPSQLGSHSLTWGGDWRQLYSFGTNIPLSVREQAGHSLKCSLKHTLEADERDDPLLPRSGFRVKMAQEVAGVGGDVCFGKAELQSEAYWELFSDWVLSLSLWGGVMRPYTPSRINDRFFLGGPTTLKGFGMWGTGPREQGYSLGGEAYWATGLHLFAPLPFVRNELVRRIRIHSFATAGNLIHCSSLSQLPGLSRNIRCSCGVGLHFRLGVAQIELNYALPLRAQPTDQLSPGLQFGIGLEML